jgi:hypothetical protein
MICPVWGHRKSPHEPEEWVQETRMMRFFLFSFAILTMDYKLMTDIRQVLMWSNG